MFHQNLLATAVILVFKPLMRNIENFFGSLLKVTYFSIEIVKFYALKGHFGSGHFITPQTTVPSYLSTWSLDNKLSFISYYASGEYI